MMTRRGMLLATVATSLLAACGTPPEMAPRAQVMQRQRTGQRHGKPIIDVHCHIFNGNDLPIGGYTTAYAVEKLHAGWARPLLYAAQTFYANLSMGPAAERALLRTTRPGEPLHEVLYRETRSAQHFSDWGVNTDYNWGLTTPRARNPQDPQLPTAHRPDADDWKAFLGYMAKPRSSLALMLAQLSRRGPTVDAPPKDCDGPVMLTPALVDMTNWVNSHDTGLGWLLSQITRNTLDRLNRAFEGATGLAARSATIQEQMEVMELLSERRPDGILIHPFVPYDPWRGAVDLAAGRTDEALRWVRNAVLRQGAIGVKLYPPMGFRAMRNAELDLPPPAGQEPYPFPIEYRRAIAAATEGREGVNQGPGYWLDQALRGLYAWCDAQQVPVMAHTGPSHSSNGEPPYLCRAEPAFWVDVLKEFRQLHVNLGHAGGIWQLLPGHELEGDSCRAHGALRREDKWLDEMVELLAAPEFAGRVFADIADQPLPEGTRTERFGMQVRALFGDAAKAAKGLMYGTDFPFTVLEEASLEYRRNIERALGDPQGFGMTEKQVDAVMYENAARFLGLTRLPRDSFGAGAERLIRFHANAMMEYETGLRPDLARARAVDLLEPFLV